MCGIGGILTSRTDLDLRQITGSLLSGIRHRGPDDEGTVELHLAGPWRLGLVHSRLSILDTSASGHQPMHDAASDTWIVYNGEIYNHRDIRQQLGGVDFRSQCDTETILKAWSTQGSSTLDSMRGMFAMAIYDGRARELYLVRDRLGIKPLYVYQYDAETWIFASEVRALLASGLVPRKLNPIAVDSYLAFGAPVCPWTMIDGVTCVAPGELWKFKIANDARPIVPDRVRYWRLNFASKSERLGHDEAVERLRPALLDSFSTHMISDVPVGVFLSGGVDSSSLVAALAYCGHSLNTFSVHFGEREYDESLHAAMVAKRFGTTHTALTLSPSTAVEQFQSVLTAYDQPSIDGFNTYFISQAVAQAGIKVALSGLGGDELFAGYTNFRLAAYLDRPINRVLARYIQECMRVTAPGSSRAAKLDAILKGNGQRLRNYTIIRQLMMPERRKHCLSQSIEDDPMAIPVETAQSLDDIARGLDPINAYSLFELSLYLSDMLLRDADQMSMVHPVEIRVPLLDHVLVETIASIPGSLKAQRWGSSVKKRLLVDALPQPLPAKLSQRPKMGFVLPWELWLRNELASTVSWILHDEPTVLNASLKPDAVIGLWNGFLTGKPGIRYTDILGLVNLLHWVREHRVAA